MKTITYEDFARFKPCWLTDEETRIKHAAQLARYRNTEKGNRNDKREITKVSGD